ncbi:MAG: hypothetical protein JWM85_1486 [Acidimicrobiaceae bacterium]|nr:hypothetical protein [Acidimicrobiaceae bacterium]
MQPEKHEIGTGFTVAVCAISAGLALALALFTLAQPDALFGVHPPFTGYDDGVYFGVAVRFVHGVLPYRDFVFVQPPGIALVMSPLALISRAIGTRDGFAAARLLTAVVVGANAALAALVLRRRGRVAMAVAGLTLALFPLTAAAAAQDELEPYVILFCLGGVAAAFAGRRPTSRQLLLAGLLVGFATTIKLVAAVPAVVLVLCFLPDWRRMRTVAIGAVAGFVIPMLVFVLPAPSTAFHEMVTDQLGRKDSVTLSLTQRFVMLFGIGSPANVSRSGVAEVLVVVLALAVVLVYGLGIRRSSRLDWYVLAAAAAVLAEFDVSREFFDHYAYLSAPFLALLLGVLAGRATASAQALAARFGARRPLIALGAAALLGALVAIGFGLPHVTGYETRYVSGSNDPGSQIAAAVPAGACVVSDQVTTLLVANRFDPARQGCPPVIDPYGMFLVDDHDIPPPGSNVPPSFVRQWESMFDGADAVVLAWYYGSWVPTTKASGNDFNAHQQEVSSANSVNVYLRKGKVRAR